MQRIIRIGGVDIYEGYCTTRWTVSCDLMIGSSIATDSDVYRILNTAEDVSSDNNTKIKAKHGNAIFTITKQED